MPKVRLKMKEALRKTGVDMIGEVPWGTHICLFYEDKSDLLEIFVPYFKAGLENNEFCVWVVSEPLDEGQAIEAMRKAMPKFDQYLEKGQIEVLPHADWYLKEGEFGGQAVLNGLPARLDQTLAKGYKGVRGAGCVFTGKEDWKKIVDYEKDLNEVIGRYPMLAICNYPIDQCGVGKVIDVAANHRFILLRRDAKWELVESARLKRAEDALRKSEEQLRLVTDSLPVLIADVDTEQRFRFINKAYESWYNLPREEICGHHLTEVLGEAAYRTIQRYVEAALSGQQIAYEEWLRYRSGSPRYVSGIYVPYFDKQRQVEGFFALVTDITEKRKAEEQLIKYGEHLEELVEERTARLKKANERLEQEIIERRRVEEAWRENERRLNRSQEIARLGSWELDLVNNRLTWSDEVYRIFGLQPHEFAGTYEAFLDAVHPDDRTAIDAAYSGSVCEGRDTYEVEHRVVRKSTDEVRVVLEKCEHIRDASGRIIRSIGMVHDITERKRAEEALRESEERYRILFETSPDAIGLVDLNFSVITVNRPTLALFGFESSEDVIGKNVLEFVAMNDRTRAAGDAIEVLRTGGPKDVQYSIQIKNGALISVELRASLIRDTEGKAKCFIAVIRDITERKASEEKIRIYEEQLRSLASQLTLLEERERRRIANDLHDHIGQNLALSKIKLGELRSSASPSLVKPLDEIHRLIEETIRYTRSLTFELSPPILYEVGFEAAVEWLAELTQEKHGILVDFEDDLEPKPLGKEMRVLLFKAVSELLMNIIKHAKAHKAKVAIQREGSNIRITVEDDGVGFGLSEANQLAGVKGFGLFSIRERLRHFGGSLEIRSGHPRGTLITLLAPTEQKENEQEVQH
jgi:PAS domain S-box-containing protein